MQKLLAQRGYSRRVGSGWLAVAGWLRGVSGVEIENSKIMASSNNKPMAVVMAGQLINHIYLKAYSMTGYSAIVYYWPAILRNASQCNGG